MASDILIVDDEADIREGVAGILSDEGHNTRTAKNSDEALAAIEARRPHLVFLDIWLQGSRLDGLQLLQIVKEHNPSLPVVMISGHGNIETAVSAIKLGAYDFIEKPFKADRLVLVTEHALEASRLKRELTDLRSRGGVMKSGAENFLTKPVDTDNLEMSLHTALELGDLRRQNRIKRQLDRNNRTFLRRKPGDHALMKSLTVAAASNTVLLISGETGTGKGVLSRWIHENSDRAVEAFVELNCSCLKGDLLRSELFGMPKGSFTSAVADREGLIELADKGTLFLDEIGDMDLAVQAQLLKTIEEQTYRRVGENRITKKRFPSYLRHE